ncbi:MAG: cation:proton antiporter [Mangrovibacterium sp.]
MSPYIFVISLCIVIIVSFIFNLLAKKTNIPSVLMLILLGMGIRMLLNQFGIEPEYFATLEILGIVGLIMIVLEAALDLKLSKDKWPLIWKSFLIALVSLGATSMLITWIIQLFIQNIGFLPALIHAIPFSIMSSAIIIPSVGNLSKYKREFMIYESTFSDILGIMLFYFLIDNYELDSVSDMALSLGTNIMLTMILAVVLSYGLLLIIQNIKGQAKFFLFLSVLVLMYAVAKMFHLSSLLIILVFGLLLSNYKLITFGKFRTWLKDDAIDNVFDNFNMITIETSFLVRTFFFVVFGISLSLDTLSEPTVWIVSGAFIVVMYLIRLLSFTMFDRKDMMPQIFLAPRGLISILLFYAIPANFQTTDFPGSGALLIVILSSSIIMATGLIIDKNRGGVTPKISN